MKAQELRKLIREEIKQITTSKKPLKENLDPDTKEQIEALMDETIVSAFSDDMALNAKGTKLAVDYLIQLLLKFKNTVQ
jgi:flagellar biosynthesis/type III secretory pathway chaperone